MSDNMHAGEVEIAIGADDLEALDQGELRRLGLGASTLQDDASAQRRLIEALGDTDWRVRREAATALALIDEGDITERLVGTLGTADAGLRNAAMKALIKRGEESVPGLLQCLREVDVDARVLAAVSLGQIRSPLAVRELVSLLDSEPDDNVRYMIIEALGRIRDPRALIALMGMLSETPWLAAAAACALGEIGSPHATPRLIELLGDPIVGGVAAEALGMIGDARAVMPLYEAANASPGSNSVRYLLALGRVLGNGPVIRAGAGAVLRLCVDEPSEHIIDALNRAMSDRDPAVRQPAAAVAGWLAHKGLVSGLVATLEDPVSAPECASALVQLWKADATSVSKSVAEAPPFARSALLGLLAKEGSPGDVVLVRALLDDANPHVRAEAVAAVGALGRHDQVGLIAGHLYDPVIDVRLVAASTVGRLGVLPVADEIVALSASGDAHDRLVAASTLARAAHAWESAELVEAIQSLVRDPDPRVRAAALPAMSSGGGMAAVEYAIAMTVDSDLQTGLAAVTALTDRAEPAAREALRELVRDSAPALRSAALRGIAFSPVAEDCDLLFVAAQSSDVRLVMAALDGLSKVDCDTAVAIALECATHASPDVRAGAVRIFASVELRTDVRDGILSASTDDSWLVRCAAAEAIGAHRLLEGLDALNDLVIDPDVSVRCAALRALAATAGIKAVPTIAEYLDSADVGREAVAALRSLGPKAISAVESALEERPETGGYGLAQFLGRADDDAGREALVRLARSEDALVRWYAAIGVALGAGDSWVPDLRELADAEESPAVRRVLEAVLNAVVGEAA